MYISDIHLSTKCDKKQPQKSTVLFKLLYYSRIIYFLPICKRAHLNSETKLLAAYIDVHCFTRNNVHQYAAKKAHECRKIICMLFLISTCNTCMLCPCVYKPIGLLPIILPYLHVILYIVVVTTLPARICQPTHGC